MKGVHSSDTHTFYKTNSFFFYLSYKYRLSVSLLWSYLFDSIVCSTRVLIVRHLICDTVYASKKQVFRHLFTTDCHVVRHCYRVLTMSNIKLYSLILITRANLWTKSMCLRQHPDNQAALRVVAT